MASAPPSEAKDVQLPVVCKWKAFRNQLFLFSKNMHKSTNASRKDLVAELKSLFCAIPPQFVTYTAEDEICIAFWAFGTTEQQRVLLKFMRQILHPRIYVASETRSSQIEGMFVLNPKFLQLSADALETWIAEFLDRLGMSAGIASIDKYMGRAMLTCMDRIEHGTPASLKHNMASHPDFLRLYRLRLGMRDEQQQVLLHTRGMTFSSSNMVALWMENSRIYEVMRVQNTRERRTEDQRITNGREAMNIIDALFLTNAVNLSTHSSLQQILTPDRRDIPQAVALRRLYSAFQQSQPFHLDSVVDA